MASIGVHHKIRTIPARLADNRNRPAVYCVKMRLLIVTPAIISATGAGLKLVNENPLRPAPSLAKKQYEGSPGNHPTPRRPLTVGCEHQVCRCDQSEDDSGEDERIRHGDTLSEIIEALLSARQ